MKLMHLSDLHLGKRVNEFSMLEDQAFILQQILKQVEALAPDALLIAGDIYDRSAPSTEAVSLLDDFLVSLSAFKLPVFLLCGNHDSPERLAFGARILSAAEIHISPVYDGNITPVSLEDEHGIVDVYMLPFVKPLHVRRAFPEEEIVSYTDAVACAVSHMPMQENHRRVLLAHQFVTGSLRCESEEISVGGSDNVDVTVFAPFDYVALGHLHGAQQAGSERVRYCGSPLKYSFSEVNQVKSITMAELGADGELCVTTHPLVPWRDLLKLRGTFHELTTRSFYESLDCTAYFRVLLTDEEQIAEAMGHLRAIYPNIMQLEYDNARTRRGRIMPQSEQSTELQPMDLLRSLYEQQNGRDLSPLQQAYALSCLEEIWGVLR